MRISDWSSDVCSSDLILRRAESGREIHGFFCAACGTRLYDRFPVFSEIMVLKAGTLDDTSGLEPVAQFWTSRKQDWVALPADQLLDPRQPDGFDAVIARSEESRVGKECVSQCESGGGREHKK